MGEVKWIKFVVDFFDDTKIKLIEDMPEGDTIIVIWFKLMSLAGKCNTGGSIMVNSEIPFTEEMLFTYLKRPIATCRLAMITFQNYRMIEVIEDMFCLANWEKHQNIDGLDKIRAQNKLRQKKHRTKQKNLITKKIDTEQDIEIEEENNCNSNVTVTLQNTPTIGIDFDALMQYWNIETQLKGIVSLTAKRIQLITDRVKQHDTATIKVMVDKVIASKFLNGNNDRKWQATFMWCFNEDNFLNIIEGNYDDAADPKNNDTLQFTESGELIE